LEFRRVRKVRGELVHDKRANVPAQNPLPLETEKTLHRAVYPGYAVFCVNEQERNLRNLQHVVNQRLIPLFAMLKRMPQPVLFRRFPRPFEQVFHVQRFGKVIKRLPLHAGNRGFYRGASCDDDDRQGRMPVCEPLVQLLSFAAR
jgi:hypothetical protein